MWRSNEIKHGNQLPLYWIPNSSVGLFYVREVPPEHRELYVVIGDKLHDLSNTNNLGDLTNTYKVIRLV